MYNYSSTHQKVGLIVYDSLTTTYNKETLCSNYEAFASDILENLEEAFPQYYMHGDVGNSFKY